MNKIIWTRQLNCPKSQLEYSDGGFKIKSADNFYPSTYNICRVEIGVSVKTREPLVLLFTQVDDWLDMMLLTKQIILLPELYGKEIVLEFIGKKDDNLCIPAGAHIANMVPVKLNYCNLLEVSSKQFGENNV